MVEKINIIHSRITLYFSNSTLIKAPMLSYQHSYHAGNFADVIKHFTLTRLLHYMTQKDKPLLYLETHSGRGMYDLEDKHTLKTGEARQGIDILWAHRKELPDVFTAYLKQIVSLNKDSKLRYYPGSPWLALNLLREQDRLFCYELHPGEFQYLDALPRQKKRLFTSNSDGLDSLSALLPPPERRSLIFVDPSYEIKTEYRHIPEQLKLAYHRFETGVYCIWYPIVDNKFHSQLLRGLKSIGAQNNLRIEFYLTGAKNAGMTGCGLWVINPPYVLENEVTTALIALKKLFSPGTSSYLIEN